MEKIQKNTIHQSDSGEWAARASTFSTNRLKLRKNNKAKTKYKLRKYRERIFV